MELDRAYLKGGRAGSGLDRLEAEVARILGVLSQSGGVRVEPEILQPADVLLDLYGEDIRARAFITADDHGELMLRPDFTVPIANLYASGRGSAARYVYCGPVWRRQDDPARPREYLQAGLELHGNVAAQTGDAEVFALIREALGQAPVDFMTGDMGLILAAIEGLETNAARKAALRRHVWRPDRFRALVRRYGPDHEAITERRAEMIRALRDDRAGALIAGAGVEVGARGAEEVLERLKRLAVEAETPPLEPSDIETLEAVLSVSGGYDAVLGRFETLAARSAALGPAVERFALRRDALGAQGVDTGTLPFEAGFGRTTLEYYDGFVFGAIARSRPDLPPVASGGRYDALTKALHNGAGAPAVGGIVRPEVLLALEARP